MMNPVQSSALLQNSIDVWKIDLSDDRFLPDKSAQILSIEETSKSNSFHFSVDRNNFISSHIALRLILSTYLNQKPHLLNFFTNKYGKPFLTDSTLKFNLSHSGEIALVAICENDEIGIDVELLSDEINYTETARNFFSKNETYYLDSVSKTNLRKEFFRIWTRKEAFIKAEGRGLAIPLQSFSVIERGKNQTEFDVEDAAQINWHGRDLEIEKNYAAALVTKCEANPSIKNFNSLFQTSL